jgi:hypothetical protein
MHSRFALDALDALDILHCPDPFSDFSLHTIM